MHPEIHETDKTKLKASDARLPFMIMKERKENHEIYCSLPSILASYEKVVSVIF